jgi:hypothetical protein
MPGPFSKIHVNCLWLDQSLVFPYVLDSSSQIIVNEKMKIPNTPLIIQPTFPGVILPSDSEIQQRLGKKLGFIQADLLKCEKLTLQFPSTGQRGFASGVSVYDPFCKDGWFGIQMTRNVSNLYNDFCIANNENVCPKGSKFTMTWRDFVRMDALNLTFHVFLDAALQFSGFRNVSVLVVGYSNATVTVDAGNMVALSLVNISFVLKNVNSSLSLSLKNSSTKSQSDWTKVNLITDVDSYRSLSAVTLAALRINDAFINDLRIGEASVLLDKDLLVVTPWAFIEVSSSAVNLWAEPRSSNLFPLNIIFTKFESMGNILFANEFPDGSSNLVLHNASGNLILHSGRLPATLQGRSRNLSIASLSSSLSIPGMQDLSGDIGFNVSQANIHIGFLNLNGNSTVSVGHHSEIVCKQMVISGTTVLASVNLGKAAVVLRPNSAAFIDNTEGNPDVLRVEFGLGRLPFVNFTKGLGRSKVVFNYVDRDFSEATKTATANAILEFSNVSMVCGGCSEVMVEFVSDIIWFNQDYSILAAKCENGCIKFISSPNSTVIPTQTPVPVYPTPTLEPNRVKQNVAIVCVAVLAFFIILIIVIVVVMNRTKKYVRKEEQPDSELMTQLPVEE